MKTASLVLVLLVAVLHLYFLVLEMFLWTTKRGLATFRMTAAQAAETATLAKNQGLYNGFLGCVIVAGVYGAATVSSRILLVQSLPAAIAMLLVFLAR